MSAAVRRLKKEYETLINSSIKNVIRNVTYDEPNFLTWTGFIVLVIFKTRIYHPNIDEKGQICLPIINPENWKPATKVEHVIQALVAMLHAPEVEHALRSDLAEEYAKDQKKFFKNAEEFTRKYAEKIPNL
ncbi:Ubiquitin-conjugating enzyme E2 L3, variant 3 [Schistosoma haematobium]|uniref:Ubiquitin-conjugating enzyme E2 L3, variant 3 n=1 Tax=Schistosoma haematobium TaxID=6185 RepID=A0A922IT71_SCHHA|nr:Ubiquitin-conjugating enzyme E2 L3, variant 3 [Schistosoma haematobium]KAH9587056.1 Ubiquitin-conjugating enzyme E2 L3, variant 3 [Schistosoma haematobium]